MVTIGTGVLTTALVSGVLLGLASSLHCAGMCGSIGASLMLLADPRARPGQRLRILMAAQAGRIAAYAVAGALLGAAGSSLYLAFDQAAAHLVLRWAAAVTLGWIGLSVAGLLPPVAVADRLLAVVLARLDMAPATAAAAGWAAPLAAGAAWGFLPCGIVYGTLFASVLAGSASAGGALMLGFGLGTLPAVTAGALGLTGLAALARGGIARVVIGLAIAAAGALGLLLAPESGVLCLPGHGTP